jgi:sugar phosphate isomerase/epimerase
MFKSLNPGAIGVNTDLAGAVRLAAAYGFTGVHVTIEEAVRMGSGRALHILQSSGVRASAFGLPVDCFGAEARFGEGLARLPAHSRMACELGMNRTSTWMPSWSDDFDWDTNYTRLLVRIARVAEVLADYNIRLGLEFLGPKTLLEGHRFEFIHTLPRMLDFCSQIPGGNVGLLLDVFHWYTSGATWAELDDLRESQVIEVHLSDAPAGIPLEAQLDQVRALPGETGVIDTPRILRLLNLIGYRGPVIVQPFSERVNSLTPEDATFVAAEALDAVWRAAGLS